MSRTVQKPLKVWWGTTFVNASVVGGDWGKEEVVDPAVVVEDFKDSQHHYLRIACSLAEAGILRFGAAIDYVHHFLVPTKSLGPLRRRRPLHARSGMLKDCC